MEQPTRRRLTKGHERMIGGVASGFAEYLDLDPTLVRAGLVVAGLFMPPLAVLAYLLFLVILPPPSEATAGTVGADSGAAPVRTGGIALLLLLAAAVFLFSGSMWSGMLGWGMPHMWGFGFDWFWPGRLLVPALIIGGIVYLVSRGRRA